MKQLTRADEILMVAILCLGEDAYSTTILAEVEQRAGKAVTVGSLWVSLDHLAAKGYVRKGPRKGEPSRGGRARIYYRLTPKGLRSLARIQDLQRRLWEGVPKIKEPGAGAKGDPSETPSVQ